MKLTLTNNGKYIYNGSFGQGLFTFNTNQSYIYTYDNKVKKSNNELVNAYLVSGSYLNTNNDSSLGRLVINNDKISATIPGSNDLIGVCFTKDLLPFTAESYNFTRSDGTLTVSTNQNNGERIFTLTNDTLNNISITGMAMWLRVTGDAESTSTVRTSWANGEYVFIAYHNFETPITIEPNQVYVATIGW